MKNATTNMRSVLVLLIFAFAALSASSAAMAEDKNKEQVRRMQQKISSLEGEKSKIVQEKSELEGKLNEVSGQVGRAKRNAEAANRKAAQLEKSLKEAEDAKTELSAKLAATEQQLAETGKTLESTTTTLHETQSEKRQLEANLAQRNQEYSACTAMNESLHRLGADLLKQYQDKSCFVSMMQKEPFTQLKSVGIENQVEEYREKLDEQVVDQQAEEKKRLALLKEQAQKPKQEEAPVSSDGKAGAKVADRQKVMEQGELDEASKKVKEFFTDVFSSEGWF
jgi:chromosome segregation ATPase